MVVYRWASGKGALQFDKTLYNTKTAAKGFRATAILMQREVGRRMCLVALVYPTCWGNAGTLCSGMLCELLSCCVVGCAPAVM